MSITCIQESFFSAALQAGRHVTMYLLNGTRVSGKVRCYDKYSVIVENNEQEQLIFKHSISAAFLCRKEQCRECSNESQAVLAEDRQLEPSRTSRRPT